MKPYARLRGLMVANGDRAKDIANMLLISTTTVSNKLNDHSPWDSDEMWALMEKYNIDPSEMAKYFPKHGMERLI